MPAWGEHCFPLTPTWRAGEQGHGSFLQVNSASEVPEGEMPPCSFWLSKNGLCFEAAYTTGAPTAQTHTFSYLINVRLKQTNKTPRVG